MKNKNWNINECEFLKENYFSLGPTLCSNKLNRSYKGVQKKAFSLKLKYNGTTGPINKLYLWEDAFKKIDTEEKAYWLGFLAADGCIRKNKSGSMQLSVHLSEKDIEHLEKFRNFLKAETSVKNCAKKSIKFIVVRKKLTNDLIKWGIVPAKTEHGINIPNIKNNLKIHWVRGVVDGDGSFWRRKRNNNLCFSIVSSTEEFIYEFKKWLEGYGIFGGSIYKKTRKCWGLTYECKKANAIRSLLYDNSSIFLERKKNA